MEKGDFDKVLHPETIATVQIPTFNKPDTSLDILCNLLKSWGNCSDNLVEYMKNTQLIDADKIQSTLADALNPESLKELIAAQNPAEEDLEEQA